MEALLLLFAKFTNELLSVQIACISLCCAYFLYHWTVKRRERLQAEWVPAAVVKEHLDRIAHEERVMRQRLFGQEYTSTVSAAPGVTAPAAGVNVDEALVKELAAVRAQLTAADQRASEYDKRIAALQTEKGELEKKAATGAPAAGADPQVQKQLEDLKAKLAEYEVIEDDLANLKKYQLENKTLQERLSQYEKGGSSGATAAAQPTPVAAVAPAPAPAPEPKLAEVVQMKPAAVEQPAPVATAPAPAPEAKVETPAPVAAAPADPAAAPVAGAPAAAPAGPEKSAKEKEQDLLSEFEKMLAS